ncbi:MAG TPA: FAD-dependent monooxygenase [Oculatellaceae cyanobacterium]|jgi:2-polyprenyl-6-methoxyphenol hydroxylase-like FAD-dependent oxidoreductase
MNDIPIHINGNNHALVIGGSIAGLLAARVLVDYFDQVTIVERDRLPAQPIPRPGVPQSYQLHVLLSKGNQILEKLFPGFSQDLANAEAQKIDWAADFRWLTPGGWSPRFVSEITTHACTRNLLEFRLRERLLDDGRVKFCQGSQVTGLLANSDHTVITGVRLRDDNAQQVDVLAQLIVDASGRNSKSLKWLQQLGYQPPQKTVVNAFLGYATRWYQNLSTDLDYKVLYVMPKAPDYPRGGVIYPAEGDRWLVSLIGVGRDYPPTDEAGFREFARSLRTSEVYEAIKSAQPLSPIYSYQRTENCWHHYERMSRRPENFIALGDAVCAFNPVYGQGMTVAALSALTLDECLQQHPIGSSKDLTGLAQRFQTKLAKVNSVPWLMATNDDFRWSTTEGGKPNLMTRLLHSYLDKVLLTFSSSPELYKVFIEVVHMLKTPNAFFHPRFFSSVFKLGRRSSFKI